MSGTHSRAKKIVTTFGAGLACAALSPSAEAAIVPLTPTPGTVGYNPSTSSTFCVGVALNGSLNFCQYNDFIGRTMDNGNVDFNFYPASTRIGVFSFFFDFNPGRFASGTWTLGFRTFDNRLGWLRANYGGPGGAITYLAGALNTVPYQWIHSGSFEEEVPEPTTMALLGLSALAVGARGVHRMRANKQH